jgi:hypothetical protein
MAQLFGREWTKRELLARAGDLAQIAGVERFTIRDGVSGGVEAARVRTGGGLDYTVLLSRGMDIGQASYNGTPLAWISATGAAHPHAFEPIGQPPGRGWLRTFHGGLLTGCGLQNAGAATTDADELLGLHGYLSHTPADAVTTSTTWTSDRDAVLLVEGTMREARVFGENLRLIRRITSALGGSSLTVEDRVENLGFQDAPLMLLYHLNFGWPLVSEDSEVILPRGAAVTARDAVAADGIDRWNRLEPPTPDYAEQCFFHDVTPNADGVASALLVNRARRIGVAVAYSAKTLPYFTQWKMMGQGEYVCGLEPANCRVLGRAAERASGRLAILPAGEEQRFRVSLSVLDGPDAIAAAEAAL